MRGRQEVRKHGRKTTHQSTRELQKPIIYRHPDFGYLSDLGSVNTFVTDIIPDWTQCDSLLLLYDLGLDRMLINGSVENILMWPYSPRSDLFDLPVHILLPSISVFNLCRAVHFLSMVLMWS